MFGHDVVVAKDADLQRKLSVDGGAMMSDSYVRVEETAVVAGVPVVVGEHGQGGNACDVARFVVAFPSGGKPRIDEPTQDCLSTTYRIGPDSVVIERQPSPSAPGRRWVWTPDRGFSPPETLAFAPSDKSGWDALRTRSIRHPEQLFGFVDLGGLLRSGVPAPLQGGLGAIIGGPGSVTYRDGVAVAFVCRAHACGDTGLLAVLDPTSRRVFVALKEEGEAAVVSPPFAAWPKGAAEDVAHFRDTYMDRR
jgi:hypothetical protein